MIFGNGLKKFDFARQNLDGRAKCLAQKMKKTTESSTCGLGERGSLKHVLSVLHKEYSRNMHIKKCHVILNVGTLFHLAYYHIITI